MRKPTKTLSRNVWAVSLTSFFMDISTEMVINILPLFLANVLGVRTSTIGLIEGVAEATASLLKAFSGWLSDRLGERKWLAVGGYTISALAKPIFYFANSWGIVAGARWGDRIGKGIRTAPRDALVADSIDEQKRGLAFGFQRAFDTAGAMVGLLIALLIVWYAQSSTRLLQRSTFQTIVLLSLIPAVLAVVTLAVGARNVPRHETLVTSEGRFQRLGRPFFMFLGIVALFELGNFSDAFLVLRAQERGLSVVNVLGILVIFNAVYAALSTPLGVLSDRIGRRRVIVVGWLLYALIYGGFAVVQSTWQLWPLFMLYGVYYAFTYGTAKALVADLVSADLRGTAYGVYNAVLGIMDLPASLIAGVLWQGVGQWAGFGPAAPFFFGAALAGLAVLALIVWQPPNQWVRPQ